MPNTDIAALFERAGSRVNGSHEAHALFAGARLVREYREAHAAYHKVGSSSEHAERFVSTSKALLAWVRGETTPKNDPMSHPGVAAVQDFAERAKRAQARGEDHD